MKNLSVLMVRPHLRDIPQVPLPSGYTTRLYEPGDEHLWVAINDAADRYAAITLETFEKNYFGDLEGLRRRMFFLCEPGGRAVGTVSAWYDNRPLSFSSEVGWGRIHWVAIVPEYQGRGLSKPMMTVAMNRLAELHERAYLDTATARLVAIKVYLDFGFLPGIRTDEDADRWRYVAEHLDHPALADPGRWYDVRGDS